MVFDNHYDTTAICMASRASVMTGMLEYKTGCNFEHGALLQTHWEASYPKLLRAAGYRTAFAGKFGFEVAPAPDIPGILPQHDFDKWGGGPDQTFYETHLNESMAHYASEYPHSTLSYGAFGRDFISDSAGSKQPFCLSISFKAPHHPVTPDPKFDQVYAGQVFTKPGNFGREFGTHLSEQSKQGRQYERFYSWSYDHDYNGVMAKYYQQIYAIDVAVGMIRDALRETGQAKNTVIIYTSDNGFICGAHGYASKVLPYEEASRVPLIVFDPRHRNAGQQLRCGELTGNIDFAPTILQLAGLEVPTHMDGKSLLPLLDNPTKSIHAALPLINVWGPAECHSLAVKTRDWKFIYWPYSEKGFQPTEELFHTASDPLELHNVIGDESVLQAKMELRAVYDQAVLAWQQDAVEYHNYRPFAEKFRRADVDHEAVK
jgi:arylsulfatase A-like enzyme